jgi:ribosomal protein L9
MAMDMSALLEAIAALPEEQRSAFLLSQLSATDLDKLIADRAELKRRAAAEQQEKLATASVELARMLDGIPQVAEILARVGATSFTYRSVKDHKAGEPDLEKSTVALNRPGAAVKRSSGAVSSSGTRMTLESETGKKLDDWFREIATEEQKAEYERIRAEEGSGSNSRSWSYKSKLVKKYRSEHPDAK